MRVITGTARGCRLQEPKGQDTRPTTDKVKEGIFSAIQFEIEGRRVLDLFAGTGQLGIEALSRGAKSAVFIDNRSEAAALVRENLKRTRLGESAEVLCTDALRYLRESGRQFDIVFLDPPYGGKQLQEAFAAVMAFDILAVCGIVIAEYPNGEEPPKAEGVYRCVREYRYGRINAALYRRDAGEVIP